MSLLGVAMPNLVLGGFMVHCCSTFWAFGFHADFTLTEAHHEAAAKAVLVYGRWREHMERMLSCSFKIASTAPITMTCPAIMNNYVQQVDPNNGKYAVGVGDLAWQPTVSTLMLAVGCLATVTLACNGNKAPTVPSEVWDEKTSCFRFADGCTEIFALPSCSTLWLLLGLPFMYDIVICCLCIGMPPEWTALAVSSGLSSSPDVSSLKHMYMCASMKSRPLILKV